MPTPFTAVITSDRYSESVTSLDSEHELLAQFPDIEVDLIASPIRVEADLVRIGNEADAMLLSTRDAVTRRALEQMKRVKVIARYGVGLDNVDLEAATDHGVVVTHYPQYCTNEVADHTVSLILTLNRRIAEQNTDLHNGAWLEHGAQTRNILRGPVPALRETTVGLIALGRIGEMVTNRLRAFGCRVIVTDPYVSEERIRSLGCEPMSFDELVEQADVISVQCPLTPETRGLLNAAAFARMKPNVVIINTARGPVIDQTALIAFLQANPEARAGLDVFEEEPLPMDSPLYQFPNVVLTPHSAYYSERSIQILREETFLSAIAVLRGFRPPTVANPAVLEKVHLNDPVN